MPSRMRYILILGLLLCSNLANAATGQFQSWYPWLAVQLQTIVQRNCSSEYQAYLSGNVTKAEEMLPWPEGERDALGGVEHSILTDPVVNCILNALSECTKANMAVAAVFLGLMPTILSTVGSSTAESALLSLVARRPLLAFLLAAGSPAVLPLRAFQYYDPSELLQPRNQGAAGFEFPTYGRLGRITVTLIEYALAIASIANVGGTAHRLGIQTVNSIGTETTYLPLLWTFLAPAIHASGCLTFWLMVKIDSTEEVKNAASSLGQLLRRRAKLEFTPAAYTTPPAVHRVRRTIAFLGVSWLTEIGTVGHILLGTTVFSGTLFLSSRDALWIGLRYLASVVCCRIILAYETAGLRHAYGLKGTSRLLQQTQRQRENDSAPEEVLTKDARRHATT